MKLVGLAIQPVGQYALGNIPTPNEMGVANEAAAALDRVGRAAALAYDQKVIGDFDEATGEAAKEISELRAKLTNQNTIPVEEVPEEMGAAFEITVPDGEGGREGVDSPVVFTHDVADQLWNTGTEEIIAHYAETIPNEKARAKFIGEMNSRYVAPGTLAVTTANLVRRRAYGQARAERSVENVLASDAPSETREEEARDIIERQMLAGADPVWVEKQLEALGPMIDQFDTQNDLLNATSQDEVDQIEEDMYTFGNRMTPAQTRAMSVQADKKRTEFKVAKRNAQIESADELFVDFVAGDLTNEAVSNAVRTDVIDRQSAWVLYNAMNKGSTTTVSDKATLSRYRGEIQKLQYTGGTGLRVTQKGELLKLMVTRGSMGLNAQGVPTGFPATVTGVDSLTIDKEIDAAVKRSLEDENYKNALSNLQAWTRTKLDLEGQFVTQLRGNQNQVEAAVAFKTALDNYMDQYGADAKAVDFVDTNKDAFDPRNFEAGINGSFMKQVPQAASFMDTTTTLGQAIFPEAAQEAFEIWLTGQVTTLEPNEFDRIEVLFNQYYRGQGRTPDSAMMLEPEDPLYWQFQDGIRPNE